jgi:hypothetical protein
MAKRKAESQIGSLTPDHGKSGIDPIYLHVEGVRHVVRKLLDKGYNFSLDLIAIGGLHKKIWSRKVAGVPTVAILWLPFGNLGTKRHLNVGLAERHKVYYMEGGGFPRIRAVVSLVSPWSLMVQLC